MSEVNNLFLYRHAGISNKSTLLHRKITFISILAYHVLIGIEYQLSKNEDHRCWKTIRTTLETHQRCTIILTDEKNRVHHIRQSGQPEPVHQDIYEKLNIKDPLIRNQASHLRRHDFSEERF